MVYNYSKRVIQHFKHPHNVGEIKNADGVGKAVSPVCGDFMTLYIKVKGDKIKDIRFKTFGCAASIASSSVLSQMAKGKNIAKAAKITKNDIVKKLGGLPRMKIHCSVMAADALRKAIKDYKKKKT